MSFFAWYEFRQAGCVLIFHMKSPLSEQFASRKAWLLGVSTFAEFTRGFPIALVVCISLYREIDNVSALDPRLCVILLVSFERELWTLDWGGMILRKTSVVCW